MDDDGGYTRGAHLQFFDTALRHYQGGGVRLERFIPLDIVSLTPRDEFFRPLSWKVNVGLTRDHLAKNHEPLVFRLNGGPGLTYKMPAVDPRYSVYYGFLEGSLDAGKDYQGNYALGAGPSIGWLADLSNRWRVNLEARALRYGLGDTHDTRELAMRQRFSLTEQSAVRVDLFRQREFHDTWNSAEVSLLVYF